MNALHHHAGFSLVEVMVSILILGVALVGLSQGVITALRSSKDSELQTTAALIAAGQIELLRAEGYLTDGTSEGKAGAGLALYQWRQTVSSTPIPGLHEVGIVVENSQSGVVITELRTMLFDPPIERGLDKGTDRKDSRKSKSKQANRR